MAHPGRPNRTETACESASPPTNPHLLSPSFLQQQIEGSTCSPLAPVYRRPIERRELAGLPGPGHSSAEGGVLASVAAPHTLARGFGKACARSEMKGTRARHGDGCGCVWRRKSCGGNREAERRRNKASKYVAFRRKAYNADPPKGYSQVRYNKSRTISAGGIRPKMPPCSSSDFSPDRFRSMRPTTYILLPTNAPSYPTAVLSRRLPSQET